MKEPCTSRSFNYGMHDPNSCEVELVLPIRESTGFVRQIMFSHEDITAFDAGLLKGNMGTL